MKRILIVENNREQKEKTGQFLEKNHYYYYIVEDLYDAVLALLSKDINSDFNLNKTVVALFLTYIQPSVLNIGGLLFVKKTATANFVYFIFLLRLIFLEISF